jgi:hypothetical protein
VHYFPAEDAAWTNLPKLNGVYPFSMGTSKEILVHREVNKHHVDEECCAWLAVAPVVDNICKTVHLGQ